MFFFVFSQISFKKTDNKVTTNRIVRRCQRTWLCCHVLEISDSNRLSRSDMRNNIDFNENKNSTRFDYEWSAKVFRRSNDGQVTKKYSSKSVDRSDFSAAKDESSGFCYWRHRQFVQVHSTHVCSFYDNLDRKISHRMFSSSSRVFPNVKIFYVCEAVNYSMWR